MIDTPGTAHLHSDRSGCVICRMFTALHRDQSEYNTTAPFAMPSYQSVMGDFNHVSFLPIARARRMQQRKEVSNRLCSGCWFALHGCRSAKP